MLAGSVPGSAADWPCDCERAFNCSEPVSSAEKLQGGVTSQFLLRVPWTARRSNQSILKEISPEYSFKGLMLKLKFQYFGHLTEELTHWKRP